MTFTILVYDVKQEKNQRILSFLRRRLNWVQNSVFEGDLTRAQLRQIKQTLSDLVGPGDSVIIYQTGNKKYVDKEIIGEEKESSSNIL